MVEGIDYVVIWNGRGPLLPDRQERWDTRFTAMPNYDLDENDEGICIGKPDKVKRIYNRTGRHKGIFSRTNPGAIQYRPRVKA